MLIRIMLLIAALVTLSGCLLPPATNYQGYGGQSIWDSPPNYGYYNNYNNSNDREDDDR